MPSLVASMGLTSPSLQANNIPPSNKINSIVLPPKTINRNNYNNKTIVDSIIVTGRPPSLGNGQDPVSRVIFA